MAIAPLENQFVVKLQEVWHGVGFPKGRDATGDVHCALGLYGIDSGVSGVVTDDGQQIESGTSMDIPGTYEVHYMGAQRRLRVLYAALLVRYLLPGQSMDIEDSVDGCHRRRPDAMVCHVMPYRICA